MSADNAIVILKTMSQFKREGAAMINLFKLRPVYRVQYVFAVDNYDWFMKNQPYNVGAWLSETFKYSQVFEDYESARKEAFRQAKSMEYLEYGIIDIETNFVFYKD